MMYSKMGINIFLDVANKLKSISPTFLIRSVFDDNLEEFVLNLVKIDQLKNQGIDSTGDVIGYYSRTTASLNPKKVFNTHYTLEDSGYFKDSFELIISNEDIKIWADGSTGKKEDIIQKYGREIIGFTNKSVEKYQFAVGLLLSEVMRTIITNSFRT